jgi:two-component system sensor histidine kinase KdpD
MCLYVQIPSESASKIQLDKQRHLINNFKLATELGGEVIQIQSKNVPMAMLEEARRFNVTTICIGKPHFSLFKIILATNLFNELLKSIASSDIDLIILS